MMRKGKTSRGGSFEACVQRALERPRIFTLTLVLSLLGWNTLSLSTVTPEGNSRFEKAASNDGKDTFLTNFDSFALQDQSSRLLTNPHSTAALIDAVGGRPHFLTTLSGCRIARWILPILGARPERRDCYQELKLELARTSNLVGTTSQRILSNATMALVRPNDTIYIMHEQVEDFARDTLPQIQVDVVLLSGERPFVRAAHQSAIDAILRNPHILTWFCQNLPSYGGIISTDLEHPSNTKLAPFPFGIKQRINDDPLRPTNADYERVFLETLHQHHPAPAAHRTTKVYAGYISKHNNLNYRSEVVTASDFLPPLEYYRQLADSVYVLSPNGDRPECYRHYEALGLGACPLTNLDPIRFAHFQGSGLIFENSEWKDLRSLEKILPEKPPLLVNRNAVLEEYWMDYVDWKVQRNLTWWDRYRDPQGPTRLHHLLEKFVTQ